MLTKPRIFISVPWDDRLNSIQQGIKKRVIDLVEQAGFEALVQGERGIVSTPWSFENVQKIVEGCWGGIVIGLTRWEFTTEAERFVFITEYSHYEGALLISRHLPTLIIKEHGVMDRGVVYAGGGKQFVLLPPNADARWTTSNEFKKYFEQWRSEVNSRSHVFFGYSSGASTTSDAILNFLRAQGVTVLDWKTNFQLGGTILEQIERAERQCLGGIFLFTKDDELKVGNTTQAAPRDNVIFESGYFMNAKSPQRVLIIREEGAKMPADVGGQIYLSLMDRNNIASIEDGLLKFVRDRL